jgi:hypothetical protein
MLFKQSADGKEFTFYPSYMSIMQFEWQLRLRANRAGTLEMPANAALIIGAASFVEAVAKSLLSSNINFSIDEANHHGHLPPLHKTLLKQMDEQLLGATWAAIQQQYITMFERNMTDDSAEKEAISVLFRFRNELVHGKEITVVIDGQSFYVSNKGYKAVLDYLVKVRVLNKQFVIDTQGRAILTDEVVDHLLGKALAFVFHYLERAGLPGKGLYGSLASSIFSMFDFPQLRKLLKVHGVEIQMVHTDLSGNELPDQTDRRMPLF